MQLVWYLDLFLHASLQVPLQDFEYLIYVSILHLHDLSDELSTDSDEFAGVLAGDEHNVEQLEHLHLGSTLIFDGWLKVVDDVHCDQWA